MGTNIYEDGAWPNGETKRPKPTRSPAKPEWEIEFEKITEGIDKDELSDGWWETSTGAEFGRLKKLDLQKLIRKAISEAHAAGEKSGIEKCLEILEDSIKEEAPELRAGMRYATYILKSSL